MQGYSKNLISGYDCCFYQKTDVGVLVSFHQWITGLIWQGREEHMSNIIRLFNLLYYSNPKGHPVLPVWQSGLPLN